MYDKIYEKYKTELDAVNKYIDNKFIYDIFYNYGFTINNKIIPLDSNINVYEACFISSLVNIYINKYKKNDELNILEIGLAYGTSCLIIINQILKYKYEKNYDIVDPNQTLQWKNIGTTNINNFLKFMDKKLNYNLHQESSTTVFNKLNKKYDISFIDGSHDEKIVILDIINSDQVLKPNGLIIIDDVLHKGVKNAILEFVKKIGNYKRISIKNNDFIEENDIYNVKEKKSFTNPNTMYCFQKKSIKKIAFLFLTIENPNFTKVWDYYFKDNQDKINIYIHPKYPDKITWHK
jgi:predicted O-methyltransferase YrrM